MLKCTFPQNVGHNKIIMDLLTCQNLDLISSHIHYYLMCGTINKPIVKGLETCSFKFVVNTSRAWAYRQTKLHIQVLLILLSVKLKLIPLLLNSLITFINLLIFLQPTMWHLIIPFLSILLITWFFLLKKMVHSILQREDL